MIVTLEDALFRAQQDALLLLALIRYGFEGRHIVLTDPPFRRTGTGAVHGWLAARDELVRNTVIEAFDRGLRAFPGSTSRVKVRVSPRQQSHWHGDPPELTPHDAALLLALPLRLLLEDRHTDRHFLRCIAPMPRRAELERAFTRGWCRTEHGGGLGNMLRYVESLKDEPAECLRTWIMFDSDAQAAGQPSAEANKLQAECQAMAVPHHQLQRRSIENYLPLPALHRWGNLARGADRKTFRERVKQFEGMTIEQRHYIRMKEHFASDLSRLFQEEKFQIDPEWFAREGVRPEIDQLLQQLFERM